MYPQFRCMRLGKKNINTKKEMPSGKSSRAESGKRRERESSESSGAGNSSGQNPKPPVAEGGNLSYVLPNQPLLEHSNNGDQIRAILDNRHKSQGGSVTGTVIVNDANIPRIYSATQRSSSSRCTRLYNPQGTQNTTMVRCKLFEDAAIRPNEYKAWCEQCADQHPVHNQPDMLIICVTEDSELLKGTRTHTALPGAKTFSELLQKNGIVPTENVHIEFVDVRDGGAFADNETWLNALITREANCQCFVFWNVGTSYLLTGGSVDDLIKISKLTKVYVETLPVHIRSTPVELRHKFVFVPLLYNKEACDRDKADMDVSREAGKTPCVGQSLHKFLHYNDSVKVLNSKTHPKTFDQLLDPNLELALKIQNSTSSITTITTFKYNFRDGNNPQDKTMMNDKGKLDYFVSLILWVKNNHAAETNREMARKKVPGKKISAMLVRLWS